MDDAQKLRANTALEQAVDLAGSESALARILDVTQGAINQRRNSGNAFLTAEQAVVVEQKLGIPRATSRPDLFEGVILTMPDDGFISIFAGDALRLANSESNGLQAELVDLTRVIRRASRPRHILTARGVYGLVSATTAMSPRFDPGSLILAERHAPPATGDDVLVHHVDAPSGARMVVANLAAQDADTFTLHQHATGTTAVMRRDALKAVHRILTVLDLMESQKAGGSDAPDGSPTVVGKA